MFESSYLFYKQYTSVCAGSGGKGVDVELNQIQTLATSQNEVTDGNKDSSGSVRRQRHKKKVHWKEQTSGEKQQWNKLTAWRKCTITNPQD